VDIEYFSHAVLADVHLAQALHGKGRIVQVLPSAGSVAEAQEAAALQCVLKFYPDLQLLDAQHGNFNATDSKKVAQAWVQRFPHIDGIASMWAEQSLGVVAAFEEAARLQEVTFAPANELSGWIKFLRAHPEKNTGVITAPVSLGAMAVDQMTKILEGQPVTRGIFVGNQYIPPQSALSLADFSKPDTYWPNKMPAQYQP
jgi:ABC-type sugar transport system substrate-binding protein